MAPELPDTIRASVPAAWLMKWRILAMTEAWRLRNKALPASLAAFEEQIAQIEECLRDANIPGPWTSPTPPKED